MFQFQHVAQELDVEEGDLRLHGVSPVVFA
jgi:hypothetical protein